MMQLLTRQLVFMKQSTSCQVVSTLLGMGCMHADQESFDSLHRLLQEEEPDKDSYNCSLSQSKLKCLLDYSLNHHWKTAPKFLKHLCSVARLCLVLQDQKEEAAMDETDEAKLEIHVMLGSPLGWGYLPTVSHFNSLPGSRVLHKLGRQYCAK
jgi:hypothetical protein